MKPYFIGLVIIVVAGFTFIGLIISKNFPQASKDIPLVLNTENMIEADIRDADSTMGPAVIGIYLAGKSNMFSNGIPWADVFVCVTPNQRETSKTDTVLLLDIRTGKNFDNLGDVTKYWTNVKPAKKFKECRVLIPKDQVKKVRSYPYKYLNIQLVTDD